MNDWKPIIAAAEVYDVASDTWSDIPNMKTARHHSAGAASQGKIFVSGGMTGRWGEMRTQAEQFLSTVEVYDIASGTWSETWPMQFSRAMHSMVAIDNRLVAMGGQGALNRGGAAAQSNTTSPPRNAAASNTRSPPSNTRSPPQEAPQERSAPSGDMPLTQWGTSLPAGGCAQTPWVRGCARVVEGTEALSSVEFLDLRELAGCPGLPGCHDGGGVDRVPGRAGSTGWRAKHGMPQHGKPQHQMSTPRIALAAVYAPEVQAVEPAPSGVSDGYVSPPACIPALAGGLTHTAVGGRTIWDASTTWAT